MLWLARSACVSCAVTAYILAIRGFLERVQIGGIGPTQSDDRVRPDSLANDLKQFPEIDPSERFGSAGDFEHFRDFGVCSRQRQPAGPR